MKSSLPHKTTTAALLLLLIGLMTAPAAENKNKANPTAAQASSPPMIDPATGLPRAPWIDPAWPEPDNVLEHVDYDGLPLEEVARQLREKFKDAFDVLIPNTWQDPHNPAVTFVAQSTSVRMQLKNVRASEIFNAMNLLFDAEFTPCRWELKLNGNRPIALLRVLPERLPAPASERPPPPTTRMVFFVGELIGEGMPMEQLVKTFREVYEMSYGESKGVLQFHKEAQLLIVTGTSEQIGFAQQTLTALERRARVTHKPEGTKPKSTEPKPQ